MSFRNTILAAVGLLFVIFLGQAVLDSARFGNLSKPNAGEGYTLPWAREDSGGSTDETETIDPSVAGDSNTESNAFGGQYQKRKAPSELSPEVRAIRERLIGLGIRKQQDGLLYETAAFTVEYVPLNFSNNPYTGVFFVTILKDPLQTHKEEAQKWLRSFGLQQSDLCDLPVAFLRGTPAPRIPNPDFNGRPDGCLPLKPL